MTYSQWVLDAFRTYNPGLERIGQHIFNHLYAVRPDIANALRATAVDPFYREDKIDAFLAAVKDRW